MKGPTMERANDQSRERKAVTNSTVIQRRSFLTATLGLAAASMLTPLFARGQSSRASGSGPQPGNVSKRKLGSLEVSSLGLGCMNNSYAYGPPNDRPDAIRLIRAAH